MSHALRSPCKVPHVESARNGLSSLHMDLAHVPPVLLGHQNAPACSWVMHACSMSLLVSVMQTCSMCL
eukprot:5273671-Amphidinium_carterae.1